MQMCDASNSIFVTPINLKRYVTMRKIAKKFDEIWTKAELRNQSERDRFFKIFSQEKRYITMGIYDSYTKKYCLFDTINLVGNFRYSNDTPPELNEMLKMVS